MYFQLLFIRYIPLTALFGSMIFQNFLKQCSYNLTVVPIIGKITKFMPHGFESTGVTLVSTIYNITAVLASMIGAYELKFFEVRNGHYDRVWKVFFLNSVFLIFLMTILGVFFLGDERKLERLRQKQK